MGHKILRKNIVRRINDDGTIDYINYLSANEFSDSNTIYEIRYDFNLNGNTVDLLDNCILLYNGGSIINGTINNAQSIIGIQNNKYIKGTTTQRPTLTSIDEGYQYYDTTLHEPIWWNGTQWIDGTNIPV